jgi:hypothetical protein
MPYFYFLLQLEAIKKNHRHTKKILPDKKTSGHLGKRELDVLHIPGAAEETLGRKYLIKCRVPGWTNIECQPCSKPCPSDCLKTIHTS